MTLAVDYQFMAQALTLARRGLYTTAPNPRVGCVVVNGATIVGSGWHHHAGEPHAEVHALRAAGERAKGATAYVTLEPCHHHGRTPPCDGALIAAHVARVVIAMRDADPRTSGLGITTLTRAGIAVECGVLEDQARELNIGFVSRHERGRPWTRLKIAASLDGKSALRNGKSQWITGGSARRDGHHWRARACAVLTGIGTVIADDPQLTVRDVQTTRQPLRVVVDSRLETPLTARVLSGGRVLIAGALEDELKIASLRAHGAEVVILPDVACAGKVDLTALLRELARRGINELHVEAGYKLNGSLLKSGCIDEILLYMAPTLLGDRALGLADLGEIADLSDAYKLNVHEVRLLGADLRLLARVVGK